MAESSRSRSRISRRQAVWPSPFAFPPGLKAVLPGLPQLAWGQRDRGLFFLGSFLTSLASMLFCWGDRLGWVFFAFAFATHVASTVDVLRQRSFPAFPRAIAACATAGVLGTACYLPLGTCLTLYAYPARPPGSQGVGYLVNRRAYDAKGPSQGHWIWLGVSRESNGRAGRVLAVAGQEVEWTGRRWLVDGQEVSGGQFGPATYYPDAWRFRVPRNHVLIGPESDQAHDERTAPLMLVSHDHIVGRAWARSSPFWDRCLLL